eukprot:CAMPEP_0204574482 /NCGR_PEP_ID=MMETSP0661-20131031/40634_1 /ASSEMBLY_ACC=CAM_ASM_000606 /TAXON_ID=109239 /ORGANISM="Alexandrium margalefi, Strain AMGDE01CS-322" /LENGTH=31 /DNA_ID= /DNA_START= /DNA_END= /DNA_ORIENTATION=
MDSGATSATSAASDPNDGWRQPEAPATLPSL